jgi:hypothetical protein
VRNATTRSHRERGASGDDKKENWELPLHNGNAISKSQVLTYYSKLASKGKRTYKISGTRNAPLAHEGAELSRNSFYFKYL